jgi:hypothetical protein
MCGGGKAESYGACSRGKRRNYQLVSGHREILPTTLTRAYAPAPLLSASWSIVMSSQTKQLLNGGLAFRVLVPAAAVELLP